MKRIRRGNDVNTIARHVDYGDLLLQVSLTPETRYRYVFPSYTDIPSHLVKPNNPYLHSLLYEWTVGKPDDHYPSAGPPAPPSSTQPGVDDPYMKLYHATLVSKDDELVRGLLSSYSLQEYGSLNSFQKEYFLEDMSSGFASSQFYNPELSDHAEFRNPKSLRYQLLAEARGLWESEVGTDKLTTIQTGVIMNMVYNLCALDKVGWVYMAQAIDMGRNMGIFYGTLPFRSQRMKDAAVFTARAAATSTVQSRERPSANLRQVLQNSKDSFETLLRIYYLRHGFDRLSACANGFFLTQSNLSRSENPSNPGSPDTLAKRMTLILVAKCLYDQGRNAYFVRVLYQMMRDAMSPEDGAAIDRFAGGELTWKNHLRPDELRSDFPVHTVSKAQDPNSKRVSEMVQKYKEEHGGLSGDESATPWPMGGPDRCRFLRFFFSSLSQLVDPLSLIFQANIHVAYSLPFCNFGVGDF
ncbi:hypothetical protein OQA88_9416 [Cercophora sp. LCS_1]